MWLKLLTEEKVEILHFLKNATNEAKLSHVLEALENVSDRPPSPTATPKRKCTLPLPAQIASQRVFKVIYRRNLEKQNILHSYYFYEWKGQFFLKIFGRNLKLSPWSTESPIPDILVSKDRLTFISNVFFKFCPNKYFKWQKNLSAQHTKILILETLNGRHRAPNWNINLIFEQDNEERQREHYLMWIRRKLMTCNNYDLHINVSFFIWF
jgi:hypothetical protein